MVSFWEKFGQPSLRHPNPIMRTVETKEDFAQLPENALVYSRQKSRRDPNDPSLLEYLPWFSLAVEVNRKRGRDGDLWFFGGNHSKIMLPWQRKYWQEKQTDYWFFCSAGFAPFVTDKTGKKYLLLTLRGPDAGSHEYKFTLFNGFPRYPLLHSDPLAEHKGLALTSHRKLVERLIMIDKRTGRTVQPKYLINVNDKTGNPKFSLEELMICYQKAYGVASKVCGKNIVINPEFDPEKDFLESDSKKLPGSCCMNLVFIESKMGEKKVYDSRIALPVFGDAFGGGTQNLDAIQRLDMFFDGNIQDLALIYADAVEETNQPRDWPIVAVECDKHGKVYRPFRYETIWKSGKQLKSFDDFLATADNPKHAQRIIQGLDREDLTPVVRALFGAIGENRSFSSTEKKSFLVG